MAETMPCLKYMASEVTHSNFQWLPLAHPTWRTKSMVPWLVPASPALPLSEALEHLSHSSAMLYWWSSRPLGMSVLTLPFAHLFPHPLLLSLCSFIPASSSCIRMSPIHSSKAYFKAQPLQKTFVTSFTVLLWVPFLSGATVSLAHLPHCS